MTMLGSAVRLVTFFTILLFLTLGLVIYLFSARTPVITTTKASSNTNTKVFEYHKSKIFNTLLLNGLVEEAENKSKGKFGIVIQDLTTGERFTHNDQQSFLAASLYKLWVMATAYDEISKSRLSEGQILSEEVATLNAKFHIATESAEKTEGTVSASVKDALGRMVTYSDNYSALLLSSKIRLSRVSNFLAANDFSSSKISQELPITTASDIALFFEKLYKNELVDESASAEMLSLLKNQRIKRKIPKYLPMDVVIAHKTGELDNFTHDAGIIYTLSGDIILVILSESQAPLITEELIAELSEKIYNYYISK